MPFGRTGIFDIEQFRPRCTHCGKPGAQWKAAVQDDGAAVLKVALIRYCADRGISVNITLSRYWCDATCHDNWLGTNQGVTLAVNK